MRLYEIINYLIKREVFVQCLYDIHTRVRSNQESSGKIRENSYIPHVLSTLSCFLYLLGNVRVADDAGDYHRCNSWIICHFQKVAAVAAGAGRVRSYVIDHTMQSLG